MFKFSNNRDHPETVSAKFLVLAIGVIGLTLPLVLILGAAMLQGCEIVQNSISAYYHTAMRNYFVGALSAISLCLFAYNGYNDIDKWTAKASGVFALGVAFFPTSVGAPFTDCLHDVIENGAISTVHFISATLLFLSFAFFSFFIFTYRGGATSEPSPAKKRMMLFYRACGIIILLCIILIALYFFLFDTQNSALARSKPVYFLEAVALVFFSLSWVVKFRDMYKDNQVIAEAA